MSATFFACVEFLLTHDNTILASLVFLTTIGGPLIQLSGLLYILLPANFNRIPPFAPQVYSLVRIIASWSMLEVLTLFRDLQLHGDMEIGPDLSLNSKEPDLVILFKSTKINQDVIDEISKLLANSNETETDPEIENKIHKKTHKVRINNNSVNARQGALNVRTRSISSATYFPHKMYRHLKNISIQDWLP